MGSSQSVQDVGSRSTIRRSAQAAIALSSLLLVSACTVEPRIVVVGETEPLFSEVSGVAPATYPFEQDVSLNDLGVVPKTVFDDDNIFRYAWAFRLGNSSDDVVYFMTVEALVLGEDGSPLQTDLKSSEIVLYPGERVTLIEDISVDTGVPTTVEWNLQSSFARSVIAGESAALSESGLTFRRERRDISVSGFIENSSDRVVGRYEVSVWCQDTDTNLHAIDQIRSRWDDDDGLDPGDSAPFEVSELNGTSMTLEMCFASVYELANY